MLKVKVFTFNDDISIIKQKCTRILTLFSDTVVHVPSHGVIYFVPSVRPRNHFLTAVNSNKM